MPVIFRNTNQEPVDGAKYLCRKYVDNGNDIHSLGIPDFMKGSESYIQFYAKHLNSILGDGFAIAVAPPTEKVKNYRSSIHDVAGRVIRMARRENRTIYDASRCLTRVKDVNLFGNVTERTHLDSIEVSSSELLFGLPVVVLYDIYTNGDSFGAICKHLKSAGASKVICLAMVKATVEDVANGLYRQCA